MNPVTAFDTEKVFQPLESGQTVPPRWRWHYGHVLVAMVLMGVFWLANHAPLWHTDVWGHLKYGQWIDQHHQLPEHELFLQDLTPGEAYAPFAWLAQWTFYKVYQFGGWLAGSDPEMHMAGGVAALRFFHAVLVVARFAIMFLAFRRVSQSFGWALAGLVVMALFSFSNLGILRPQVFGELCFALLLLSLSDPVPTKLAIYGMPVVFAFWVNWHGSFIVGLVFILGIIGGQMLRIVRTAGVKVRAYWRDEAFRMLMRLLWLAILAVGLCNPRFFAIYTEIWSFGDHPNLAFMDEWKPLEWHTPFGYVFLASLVLVLCTHATGLLRPAEPQPDRTFGPIPLGQMILLVLLGWQVYQHQRMMLWWIMVMPWICLPPWARLTAPSQAHTAFSIWSPKTVGQALRPLLIIGVMVWIGFLWSSLGFVWSQGGPSLLHQSLHPGTPYLLAKQLQHPEENFFPELAAWLRKEVGHGPFPGRIFASETQGEFLLWALPSAMHPPIYTHVHLVPKEHWQAIYTVKAGMAGWRSILDRWQVNLMVFEAELHPQLRLEVYLDNVHWMVVLDETGDARKRDPRSRLLIAVRTPPLRATPQPKP